MAFFTHILARREGGKHYYMNVFREVAGDMQKMWDTINATTGGASLTVDVWSDAHAGLSARLRTTMALDTLEVCFNNRPLPTEFARELGSAIGACNSLRTLQISKLLAISNEPFFTSCGANTSVRALTLNKCDVFVPGATALGPLIGRVSSIYLISCNLPEGALAAIGMSVTSTLTTLHVTPSRLVASEIAKLVPHLTEVTELRIAYHAAFTSLAERAIGALLCDRDAKLKILVIEKYGDMSIVALRDSDLDSLGRGIAFNRTLRYISVCWSRSGPEEEIVSQEAAELFAARLRRHPVLRVGGELMAAACIKLESGAHWKTPIVQFVALTRVMCQAGRTRSHAPSAVSWLCESAPLWVAVHVCMLIRD